MLERLRVCHVIDHNDAMRSAVVAASDGAEALLASGVPNLQLDRLAVELDRTNLEVHADGGDVGLRVRIVSKAEEEARLAHATVANENKLEDIVVFLRHSEVVEGMQATGGVRCA